MQHLKTPAVRGALLIILIVLVPFLVGGIVTANAFSVSGFWSTLLAWAGGAFAYAYLATQIDGGFRERWPELRKMSQPGARWLTFCAFSLLGLGCGLGVVAAGVVLGHWIDQGGRSEQFGFALVHFVGTLLAPICFLFLALKVRMARTLALQKRQVRVMVKAIHRFETERGKHGADRSALDLAYRNMLSELCHAALRAVSVSGQSSDHESVGEAVVLFVADVTRKAFMPLATAGGTEPFASGLRNHPVPFWDPIEFRAAYDRFVQQNPSTKQEEKEAASLFRKATRSIVSVTGVVYHTERQLEFEVRRRTTPLIPRGEDIFHKLSGEQRPAFTQLVGTPVVVRGRKIGVLLFLGNSTESFYPYDEIYSLVGGMIALAIELGNDLNADAQRAVASCPFLGRSTDEDAVATLNALNSRFTEKVRSGTDVSGRILNREQGIYEIVAQDSALSVLYFRVMRSGHRMLNWVRRR